MTDKEPQIFTFKRADTPEEDNIVYRIRYDTYRAVITNGKPRIPFEESGQRHIVYDEHPSTTRFLGYINDQPAATISLTPDSEEIGVPIGKPFLDVMEKLRNKYNIENITESHSIMVLPEFQHGKKNMSLLLGLEKMIFRQCVLQDKRYLLVGMIEEHAQQVEKYFGFQRLAEGRKYGALENVDEAFILGLDLHEFATRTDWPFFNAYMIEEDPFILTKDLSRPPDLEKYLKSP